MLKKVKKKKKRITKNLMHPQEFKHALWESSEK